MAIRRTETAPTRPLCWDLPGGDLEFGEDPMQGIIRETKEEVGLNFEYLELWDIAAIVVPEGDFWVTIAYKAKYDSGEVKLSYEHDEFKWVTPEEFLQLKSSEKLQRFVKKLL